MWKTIRVTDAFLIAGHAGFYLLAFGNSSMDNPIEAANLGGNTAGG
jgi:hypothetical protein